MPPWEHVKYTRAHGGQTGGGPGEGRPRWSTGGAQAREREGKSDSLRRQREGECATTILVNGSPHQAARGRRGTNTNIPSLHSLLRSSLCDSLSAAFFFRGVEVLVRCGGFWQHFDSIVEGWSRGNVWCEFTISCLVFLS